MSHQPWAPLYTLFTPSYCTYKCAWSIEALLKSSELIASAGLPFVIGEIGWTKDETLPFLEAVEVLQGDGLVTGDLFWSMFGHAENFGEHFVT